MMKLPTLEQLAKTPIIVMASNGTDENGALKVDKKIECKCRPEQTSKTTFLPDGRQVTILMKVFIFEKLEEFPVMFSGYCEAFNYTYDIAAVKRAFNPDGTLNHIVLELM